MHIAYVCREYPPTLRGGGIATYVKQMAVGMAAAGWKVTVITASENTDEERRYLEDGVNVIRLSGGDFVVAGVEKPTIWNKLREVTRFSSYRRKIVNTLRELGDVDIIEVGEFGAESLYMDELNIPHVIRLHTPSLFDRETQGIKKFCLKDSFRYLQQKKELELISKARYISSCSEDLKQWTLKNLPSTTGSIHVIYNPVQISPIQSSIHETLKKPYILFAGTIIEWKGVNDLIEACILLHKQGDDHQLIIAGKEGLYADELKRKYAKYQWIRFVGKVNHDILYPMYAEADVVVFPSWWDNMPMVCIEAMMNGAIVIGSQKGGMKEIITHGKDGFVIPPKDPARLYLTMKKIFALPQKQAQRIREAARERIIEGFSTEVIVGQMQQYYTTVYSEYWQSLKR